jgi:hypothetical protein
VTCRALRRCDGERGNYGARITFVFIAVGHRARGWFVRDDDLLAALRRSLVTLIASRAAGLLRWRPAAAASGEHDG